MTDIAQSLVIPTSLSLSVLDFPLSQAAAAIPISPEQPPQLADSVPVIETSILQAPTGPIVPPHYLKGIPVEAYLQAREAVKSLMTLSTNLQANTYEESPRGLKQSQATGSVGYDRLVEVGRLP